jgi:hexosaminidase
MHISLIKPFRSIPRLTLSRIEINNATYLSVTLSNSSEETVREFTTTIGDYSNSFIWNKRMAVEEPVAMIEADTFWGWMNNVTLMDGADAKYASYGTLLVIGVALYT